MRVSAKQIYGLSLEVGRGKRFCRGGGGRRGGRYYPQGLASGSAIKIEFVTDLDSKRGMNSNFGSADLVQNML